MTNETYDMVDETISAMQDLVKLIWKTLHPDGIFPAEIMSAKKIKLALPYQDEDITISDKLMFLYVELIDIQESNMTAIEVREEFQAWNVRYAEVLDEVDKNHSDELFNFDEQAFQGIMDRFVNATTQLNKS